MTTRMQQVDQLQAVNDNLKNAVLFLTKVDGKTLDADTKRYLDDIAAHAATIEEMVLGLLDN